MSATNPAVPTSIGGFLIDATITEEHADAAEVTKFPVEKGADLTDHIRRVPKKLSLECVVSDTPIGPIASSRAASSVGAGIAAGGGPISPTEEARAHFEKLLTDGEPILVTTEKRIYEDMALTSFAETRDAKTGEAMGFRAAFEHITLVTNRRTTIKTATPRGRKKKTKGDLPSASVADPSSIKSPLKQRKSGGAQVVDWIGSLF